MQEENCAKRTEINTINQEQITIQKNQENELKEVTKHQDDVERINKEKIKTEKIKCRNR